LEDVVVLGQRGELDRLEPPAVVSTIRVVEFWGFVNGVDVRRTELYRDEYALELKRVASNQKVPGRRRRSDGRDGERFAV
jgi:hypothetical protein